MRVVTTILLTLGVLATAACGSTAASTTRTTPTPSPHPVWDAIFMSNGDIYFASITGISKSDVRLAYTYKLAHGGLLPAESTDIECAPTVKTVDLKSVLYMEELQEGSLVVAKMPASKCIGYGSNTTGGLHGLEPPYPSAPKWSAFFLSDDEVFFGHIKNITPSYVDIVNVYLLQKTPGANGHAELSLAGIVGNQTQCPTNELLINRPATLYWQTLQVQSYVAEKLDQLDNTAQVCVQPSPTP